MHHLSFALHRGALLILSLGLALALVACGGGDGSPAASDGTSGGGTVAVVDGNVAVSADDLAFDASVIEATAGEAFTITFTNNEAMPHNIAIYTEEGGDEIATGAVINEGETDELSVEALEPGEYFFVCDVHPGEMTGTLVVEG
jgi:plastocyanin